MARDGHRSGGDVDPGFHTSDTPTIIAPTPLPWDAADRLDIDALRSNVARWSASALSGFVVGSAGGEEAYISEDELLRAVRAVADARGDVQQVIGGIDNPSSTETLRRAEAMAAAGADLLRIRIPQTAAGGSRGTAVEYFAQVMPRSPLPVIVIHQTWQTGGFAATPEEIGEICHLSGVHAYVFWHNLRYESYVRTFLPPGLPFWCPNGSLLLPSAAIGADGACCFFANWSPEMVREVLVLATSGRLDAARALQHSLLQADFIGMRDGVAALKAGLDLLGMAGGRPRAPDGELTGPARVELAEAFRTAGLIAG
jgi:dihydrodipicolinate synthase/N-acetylneuraminate lyase